MHEDQFEMFRANRETAVQAAQDFIVSQARGKNLSQTDLEKYQCKKFSHGWVVHWLHSDEIVRDYHVLIDGAFPYSAPRIAVHGGQKKLDWPHLESDGKLLCVFSEEASVSQRNIPALIRHMMHEAYALVEECITEKNIEDFRDEFHSYWDIACDKKCMRYISLIEPGGQSRKIAVYRGKHDKDVGEKQQHIEKWLRNRGIEPQGNLFAIASFMNLREQLIPKQYPDSAKDVWNISQYESIDTNEVFKSNLSTPDYEYNVIVGAMSKNGYTVGGITLTPRSPKFDWTGFRNGSYPNDIVRKHNLSKTTTICKAKVLRADHSWVHGRDNDVRQKELSCAKVAILGCGALGSTVAKLISQSGIGKLLLVDDDTLEWPNISRHCLGAASVGKNKAEELAVALRREMPHLQEVTVEQKNFGPGQKDLIGILKTLDLIVSTMGNWAAESFLSDLQQSTDSFPPILYGWVEEYAAAAHALFIPYGDVCLRCGCNDTGRPRLSVTSFKNMKGYQEPACGALYSPFGPAELSWAHSLLAEEVLNALLMNHKLARHRVWIGPKRILEMHGGEWNDNWLDVMGDPGCGGITVMSTWSAKNICPCCGKGA